MNVSGKIIVFVHEFSYSLNGVMVPANNYSTTISNKDKEGNYSNAYMEVKFSQDIVKKWDLNDLEEGDCLDVEIKEGFLSFRSYENNAGETVYKFQIVVTAVEDICEHVKQEEKKKVIKKAAKKTVKK